MKSHWLLLKIRLQPPASGKQQKLQTMQYNFIPAAPGYEFDATYIAPSNAQKMASNDMLHVNDQEKVGQIERTYI